MDDAGLESKRRAVLEALAANAELIAGGGALGALRAVGGLELAAMAGAALEAAALGVPVVADGFISGELACAAWRGVLKSTRKGVCVYRTWKVMQ